MKRLSGGALQMCAEEVHIRGGAGRRVYTLRGQNFLSAAPRAEITCAARNPGGGGRGCEKINGLGEDPRGVAFEDLPKPPLVVGDVVLEEDALLHRAALQEVYVGGVYAAV